MPRLLFAALILKPLAWLLLGLDVYGRSRLPDDGPLVITPNHNSYIDTWLTFAALPLSVVRRLHIVGAADHFPTKGLMGTLIKALFGFIPLERGGGDPNVLAGCITVLKAGDALILFPEGTRGSPDQLGAFKSGIARLADDVPGLQICPLYLHGTGHVLPKGSALFLPLLCSAHFAPAFEKDQDKAEFMKNLRSMIEDLRSTAPPLNWY